MHTKTKERRQKKFCFDLLFLVVIIFSVIFAYAGPVVQAFRRPWCIDSGFMVHAFR